MEHFSFDSLPSVVAGLVEKIDNLTKLVQEKFDSTTHEPAELQPVILTTGEAAALLNRQVSSIYQMTSEGTIPFHKRGNKLYFFKHELIQWLQDGGTSGVGTEQDFDAHLQAIQQSKKHKPKSQIS